MHGKSIFRLSVMSFLVLTWSNCPLITHRLSDWQNISAVSFIGCWLLNMISRTWIRSWWELRRLPRRWHTIASYCVIRYRWRTCNPEGFLSVWVLRDDSCKRSLHKRRLKVCQVADSPDTWHEKVRTPHDRYKTWKTS